jgi:hypothetical protein
MIMKALPVAVVCALAAVTARAAPVDDASGDVRELIGRARAFNEICRGGDVDAASAVCRRREQLYRDLEAKGWCWEPDTASMAGAQWLRCARRTAQSRSTARSATPKARGTFTYENESPNAALPGSWNSVADPMFRQRNLHQYVGSLWSCLPDTMAQDIALRGMRDKGKVIDRGVAECAPAAWRRNYAMLIGTTAERLEVVAREEATRAFTMIPGVRERR